MIRHILPLTLFGLVACGGSSGDDDGTDGPPVPTTIMITGVAQTISAGGTDPAPDVLIEAFANSDAATVITSAMTDAQGNYTLTVTTNGVALDGFLKASKSNLLDTYLYAPEPIAENFDGASINMISQNTLDGLAGVFCGDDQSTSNGVIAALIYDAADMPVAGAMMSSSPAPSSVCYNGTNGLPSNNATATAADGIGYMFNVTGNVTVSGTAAGLTLRSHAVTARAGALTTTLIRP